MKANALVVSALVRKGVAVFCNGPFVVGALTNRCWMLLGRAQGALTNRCWMLLDKVNNKTKGETPENDWRKNPPIVFGKAFKSRGRSHHGIRILSQGLRLCLLRGVRGPGFK